MADCKNNQNKNEYEYTTSWPYAVSSSEDIKAIKSSKIRAL
jgi:hypothetical protein